MKIQRCTSRGVPIRVGLLAVALLWAAVGEARPAPPGSGESELGPVLDRSTLLAAVLERNPGILAAQHAWRAALERIPQARSLEDPIASAGIAPRSLAESDVRTGFQARIGQRFPFPGTLRLRGVIAEAEAAAADVRIDQVRLHLATMGSLLFDRYYLVARELEINAEHRQLLEDFQRVAVSRYGAGLAPQQAPILAEVEAAHLMHRELVLGTRRKTLVAQINALLHRRPRAPLPPPPADLEPPVSAETSDRELAELALDRRPELRAQRAEVEARRAAVSLERLDFYPGFEVSTSYNSMWRTPEHRWTIGFGVSVPLRRQRIRAGVAEAEARLEAEKGELARMEDEARAATEIAMAKLEEARHVIRLYESRVLPAARDQIAAARAGFETGANTMLALIEAERSLRTAQLSYFEAVADAYSRRAELDRALGRLPFLEDGADPTTEPATRAEEAN